MECGTNILISKPGKATKESKFYEKLFLSEFKPELDELKRLPESFQKGTSSNVRTCVYGR